MNLKSADYSEMNPYKIDVTAMMRKVYFEVSEDGTTDFVIKLNEQNNRHMQIK